MPRVHRHVKEVRPGAPAPAPAPVPAPAAVAAAAPMDVDAASDHSRARSSPAPCKPASASGTEDQEDLVRRPVRMPTQPLSRINIYFERYALAMKQPAGSSTSRWRKTVLLAAMSTAARRLPYAAAPTASAEPELHLYTVAEFPTFRDNIGVRMTADIVLEGLVTIVDAEGVATPLFVDTLACLTWLRLLIMLGRQDVPPNDVPATIAGCIELVSPLNDNVVWPLVVGKWVPPVVLHMRPRGPRSATGPRLREDKPKGVELYAASVTICEIVLAARCALALADGVEPQLPADSDGTAAAGGREGQLVAARLPTDIFSILGTSAGGGDSDDAASSVSTSSVVSGLLVLEDDADPT